MTGTCDNNRTTSTLTHLECSYCHITYSADELHNLCQECHKPLLARYDLKKAATIITTQSFSENNDNSLWRYESVLPVRTKACQLRLGEGWTKLHHAKRLGDAIGCPLTYIKDEGTNNVTGSFKARGLCLAVSMAYEIGGVSALTIPTAGNAGGALAAYAASAGIPAHIYMPLDVPSLFRTECEQLGATVTLIDGLIHECGAASKRAAAEHGWFDVSTLKEPYRVEGKKTMGYELAEQLQWELPDVIIYPTGGGTGMVGMWKAFAELQEMGLLSEKRPRMVSVQSAGCAPIVRAFEEGKEFAELWENAKTVADGLRVPVAVGDFLILRALRESNGTAVAISDEEMLDTAKLMGKHTGIFPAPEGAATLAAQIRLLQQGWIKEHERVVLFNTGSGLKYSHLWERQKGKQRALNLFKVTDSQSDGDTQFSLPDNPTDRHLASLAPIA